MAEWSTLDRDSTVATAEVPSGEQEPFVEECGWADSLGLLADLGDVADALLRAAPERPTAPVPEVPEDLPGILAAIEKAATRKVDIEASSEALDRALLDAAEVMDKLFSNIFGAIGGDTGRAMRQGIISGYLALAGMRAKQLAREVLGELEAR